MVFVPFYELCAEVFDEAESFATLYAMCGASDCEDDLTWESTTGNVTCAQYVSHPPPSLIKVSVLAARNGSGKTRQRQCLRPQERQWEHKERQYLSLEERRCLLAVVDEKRCLSHCLLLLSDRYASEAKTLPLPCLPTAFPCG